MVCVCVGCVRVCFEQTFWKLFQSRTLKFGQLVGVDKFGNKYYENTKDYPYGAFERERERVIAVTADVTNESPSVV